MIYKYIIITSNGFDDDFDDKENDPMYVLGLARVLKVRDVEIHVYREACNRRAMMLRNEFQNLKNDNDAEENDIT